MPVIRTEKTENFTIMANHHLRDMSLSLKARGLLSLMLSLPDDWDYSARGLACLCQDGVSSICSALKELADVGYLVKEQAHDSGGKFARNVLILQEEAPPPLSENPTTVGSSETPSWGKPSTGKPTTGKPSTVFPTVQNIEVQIQDINNPPISPQGGRRSRRTHKETADWKPERFESFWAYYRTHVRNEDRQAAIRAWDKLRPDDALIARIGRALQIQIKSQAWIEGVGKPYASTYLNNARWEDVEGLPSPPPDQPSPSKEVYGWQQ